MSFLACADSGSSRDDPGSSTVRDLCGGFSSVCFFRAAKNDCGLARTLTKTAEGDVTLQKLQKAQLYLSGFVVYDFF